MRLSRLIVSRFRNFDHFDVPVSSPLVILGENATGKSNLLHALRLILDPTLPDRARALRREDFWEGASDPIAAGESIEVAIHLQDFEAQPRALALLGDCLVHTDPLTARLAYTFRPQADLDKAPTSEADYEFVIYGGEHPDSPLPYAFRRHLVLEVLHALRDADGDLANWRRSPLRPLLETVKEEIDSRDRAVLSDVSTEIRAATSNLTQVKEVASLAAQIRSKIHAIAGEEQGLEATLDVGPTDADRLLRLLQLVFGTDPQRVIGEASLGSSNVLYLALRLLRLENASDVRERIHTFLAVEEPEAHLHPHLQRLIYGALLREEAERARPISLVLTTHSPHIASVAPLDSLLLLRKTGVSTTASSTANVTWHPAEKADLERFLDVTRAELLFGRKVIFTEGEAEKFLVPGFARSLGLSLDKEGITVCAIGGTHFRPFVQLVATRALNIPFAVLTDLDPQEGRPPLARSRLIHLLEVLEVRLDHDSTTEEILRCGREHGIFVNSHTLEVEICGSPGGREIMASALEDLTSSEPCRQRARRLRDSGLSTDEETRTFLSDVATIGKGRLAQRLSTTATKDSCPEYIAAAFSYLRALS